MAIWARRATLEVSVQRSTWRSDAANEAVIIRALVPPPLSTEVNMRADERNREPPMVKYWPIVELTTTSVVSSAAVLYVAYCVTAVRSIATLDSMSAVPARDSVVPAVASATRRQQAAHVPHATLR